MKAGFTEVLCVLDKSASMESVKNEAIISFNKFIAEQKKLPGEASFTLTLFDTSYKVVYAGVPIQEVAPLTEDEFNPGGMTALLDAVGHTIDITGERLSQMPEEDRPERVIMVILTDGEENSSREYSRKMVIDRINQQKTVYSWEFIFLAADQDAILTGASIGITRAFAYSSDSAGTQKALSAVACAVEQYRVSGAVGTVIL